MWLNGVTHPISTMNIGRIYELAPGSHLKPIDFSDRDAKILLHLILGMACCLVYTKPAIF